MHALKRFTQCGSLTMLFTVFIVLFGVSSTALTTFGKTSPNVQQPPTTPPVKGRECNTHTDCSTLQSTSCVRDPNDSRLRCLCGDNTAPVNGQCFAKYKGLRHMCSNVNECDEGMICAIENATRISTFGKITGGTPNTKACLCDEENGYEEDTRDYSCNMGDFQAYTSFFVPVFSVILSLILSSINSKGF
ncbi:unnamed protein product [Hermetia illucens]|uniref:Uncharacterized protein n=1 Tax=Hermetia illucens TaxID=343691 RepID=A0A7R8UQG5_HERIL|nr:uncharacterized protein LOC119651710 [Hermetia illucens]CAD7085152.1 unnamed protein product [Hermetia illucens]